MSLKQYSPHLQLTIHKPLKLVLGLRLLSCWIVGILLITQHNSFYLMLSCTAVLFCHLSTERSHMCSQGTVMLNEYVFGWGNDEYELQGLRVLFSYFVLIIGSKGGAPLLLSRDQFSDQDWQRLMRYNKLQN